MVIAGVALALFGLPGDGTEVVRLACVDCHSGTEAEAGFDVAALLESAPLAAGLHDWRRARAMVESNGMPPKDKLDADERDELLALFESIEAQALELGGAPGHEPVRRLTRTELRHAFRDLLGVEPDLRALLPEELAPENGFKANASTLFVGPEWLERARTATRLALDMAFPDGGPVASALEPAQFDLAAFVRRAFRRPATPSELEHYEAAFNAHREAGRSERAALRTTLFEVLSSPHFQLRLEDAAVDPDSGSEREVRDHGLASRLSFLLWTAPPDDELLDLADAGRLSDADVLAAQVDRLLADPRSHDFGRAFAGEWFGTEHLGTRVKPDPIDNPLFTDTLLAALREEVARFIHALFAENRPLDDLLRADFTFVNHELARYYRMKPVEGDGLVRVPVIDSRRRGLLGKAGVLVVTSYHFRTSPVLRGAFILDDLLGTPPPPPPPGASDLDRRALEERGAEGPRELLELHRDAPQCASCHAQIDPLGFALEGFDHLGHTRASYRSGEPVDTAGRLSDGAAFRGPTGLARVLLQERREELAREVARRLLTFALARPLEWYDERTVADLANVLQRDGFGALLRAVIASRPFRFVEQHQ